VPRLEVLVGDAARHHIDDEVDTFAAGPLLDLFGPFRVAGALFQDERRGSLTEVIARLEEVGLAVEQRDEPATTPVLIVSAPSFAAGTAVVPSPHPRSKTLSPL
jgi:hypothetical protein